MKKASPEVEVHLMDGAEWPQHEDCIIGNEAGLQQLRDATDRALNEGEVWSKKLGSYNGVKLLSNSWFESEYREVERESIFTKFIGMSLVTGAVFVFGTGLFTIVSWFL